MHRPRLKPVFTPMAVDPGTIYVAFPRTPGSAIIPDPHGGIRAVPDLLDGTRDVEDLTRDLAGHCERADIIKLLQALATERFLEDASPLTRPAARITGGNHDDDHDR